MGRQSAPPDDGAAAATIFVGVLGAPPQKRAFSQRCLFTLSSAPLFLLSANRSTVLTALMAAGEGTGVQGERREREIEGWRGSEGRGRRGGGPGESGGRKMKKKKKMMSVPYIRRAASMSAD